jgi:BirA family biotin operon repressor/biotin-[acetyl-CoA-carboxylase] ligase
MSELSAAAIAASLTTRRLGRPALFCAETGSTNDVAHQQAAAGAAEGLLVVADAQTAGRGRLTRTWWSPAGCNLYLSLLLRPPLPPGRAGQLTMCLGLAAAEAIEALTGLRPALKWPNDLLLHGRKLGGMLTELRLDGERLEYAVLGLGVNVNVEFDGGPETDNRRPMTDDRSETGGERSDIIRHRSLANTAISLSMALGRPVARLPLLAGLLARAEAWYERLLAGESPHLAWAARLNTLARPVRVLTPHSVLEGTAVGVTPEGALLLCDAAGQLQTIWAGDVTAVRPQT